MLAAEPNIVTAGDFDPSFGDGGRAVIDVGSRRDAVIDPVYLPADQTLVLGSHGSGPGLADFDALVRIRVDGTPDPTFGQAGVARLATGAGGATGAAVSGAATSDQHYLVAGSVTGNVTFEGSSDLLLHRYNRDGSRDTSFGNGGRATIDVAGRDDRAVKVLWQPDGRIVVVGYDQRAFLARVPLRPHIVLARYTADGALDPTFGAGGIVRTDLPAYQVEHAASAAFQPDGRIVMVGHAAKVERETPMRQGVDLHILVLRYNPDGTRDGSFGRGGVVASKSGSANDVHVGSNGTLLVAGGLTRKSGVVPALLQFRANGSLDGRFGKSGVAAADFTRLTGSAQSNRTATRAVKLHDGRTVLAAILQGKGLALAGFTAKGKLDADFGQRGSLLSVAEPIDSAGLVLNDGGKFSAAAGGGDILLARYLPETVKPFARILPSAGRLLVQGTDGPDEIRLSQEEPAGRALVVTRGKYSQRFATMNVRSIEVRAGPDNDRITLVNVG